MSNSSSKTKNMHNLTDDDIILINADQTAIFFENPPRSTISKVGVKHVSALTAGAMKNRLTAMLAGTNRGEKLPVFSVFMGAPPNGNNPRKNTVAHEIKHPAANGLPLYMVFDCQAKGWFDDRIMLEWTEKVLLILTINLR